MKAIILVAGYATRLYPLTLNMPKALLPINKKPIIDYIVGEIDTVDAIDEIFVVSNHKFAKQFDDWASNHQSKKMISVLDDGTETEETRRGAIGDILFTIKEKNIDDEVMIIAGDTFFTYSLKEYYNFYKSKQKDAVCVKIVEDKELIKQYGVALLDENDKIIDIEEKPQAPKSNTAVFANYIYTKDTVRLFETYIEEGNKPDAPGYFLEWLYNRKDVYGFKFDAECYDIGTPSSYEEVCKLYEK